MLEEIRIAQLGVIEASTLPLGPGLTVLTGETGAGKTMVVTALGLLLGARADSAAVRTGARAARVEGVVHLGADRPAGLAAFADGVDEAGGEIEDDRVVLARSIAVEGRSRAWVGGAAVPVSRLSGLAEPLVAVHGQSDQQLLLRAQTQRATLDRFAGPAALDPLAAFAARHTRLGEVERELAAVLDSARERAREADLLRFGVTEVEKVAPEPGEDRALAAEESRLGFADELRTAAELAREALSSDTDQPDALAAAARARALLEAVRDHDPAVASLADRLAEVTYLLSDLGADVAGYAAGIDADPVRLAAVSQRRAALTALTRTYGDTADEVLAWASAASARLLQLDGADDTVESLREERAVLRAELGEQAHRLSRARAAAAARLGEQVGAELALLAMPHARVEVRVTQRADEAGLAVGDRLLAFTASGVDEVEMLLAANSGSPARPLHRGASGGELSRVMLALEVCLAGTSPVPTLVFDEVDAGVGGAAAVEIGRRLARLARSAQVLVVTHLPQVAAYADRHVVVTKSSDGTVTSSGLTELDDAGRERELSRMLAGLADSETALAHARELLEVAAPARALH